ncbi:hypothetical protein [Dietzia sp. NCCP-2495]|uniref:hypothetical protein n=1 Tax=Dietzia sp. NCCP-2495 TaxID=2934675 RepID=UPI00222EB8F2|nr:hypothetical protein [Dietzia sp. NCCP-2495]
MPCARSSPTWNRCRGVDDEPGDDEPGDDEPGDDEPGNDDNGGDDNGGADEFVDAAVVTDRAVLGGAGRGGRRLGEPASGGSPGRIGQSVREISSFMISLVPP